MKAKMIFHPMGQEVKEIVGTNVEVESVESYSGDGFVIATLVGTPKQITKVTKVIYGSLNQSSGFVEIEN